MNPTPVPVVGIVIPAHNEEAVIARCLEVLLAGTTEGEFDVVVVPNGCVDRTTEIARRHEVRVVETDEPGKAGAVVLGDRELTVYPRIYLDADVELSAAGVRDVVKALDEPGVCVAAPSVRYDLTGMSPFARRAHGVHLHMAEERGSVAGKGAYALNAEGHARAFPMPLVIADDCWVDRSFTADERRVVGSAVTVVRPARTLSSMIRRRVRVRLGNRQLDDLGKTREGPPFRTRDVLRLVRQRSATPLDAACYLALVMMDRLWTRYDRTTHRPAVWGADQTTRAPAGRTAVGDGDLRA